MKWSDLPLNPSPRTLRQFAGLWLLFFLGLAAQQWWGRGRPYAALILALLAVGLGLAGLIHPPALRSVFVGWMLLAFPIGWTVSQVLLAVLYYGVFTPVGLFFKLRGRDSLCRKRAADRESYWEEKPASKDVRSYFRQY